MNYLKYLLLPIFFASFHWLSVRFYITFCVPSGINGYIMSYLTTASPICIYTLTLMEKSSNMYLTGWIFLSMASVGLLKQCYNYLTDEKPIKLRIS
jgi:hypothetical protein